MKTFLKVFNTVVIILTLYVACISAVFVIPRFFGIMPYIVLSGSMEPGLPTGSVAYINQHDTDVNVGDIITYRLSGYADLETGSGMMANAAEGTLVTHRLVRITPRGHYITKGDNNDVEDMKEVLPDQVVGKFVFHIPRIGYVMQKVGSRTVLVILACLVILNVVTSILMWAWDAQSGKSSGAGGDGDAAGGGPGSFEAVASDTASKTQEDP